MPTSILATKLYIPPPRSKTVLRPRLIERLNAGLHGKLTLISAAAGFGKSTLVSEWITECERPAAWLSLDEGDNDPIRFLTYVTAALQTIAPNFAQDVMGALQAPQPPPIESILTALLNEITTLAQHFILVLDDYHSLDAPPIDQALTFLVEHLPPQMHLVIATREDPNLPLARLRARGQLTELRVSDLRFTPVEAAEFLNHVMGLNLSAENIAALETRTEGWIAGLQLAALSMQGHHDATRFIQSFSGSHHFVLDYLLEEVLHQQPAGVQNFLLCTSILDHLCGPLCDAVLHDSSASSQKTLEYIEHANLFLVPLDNERRWYRYHHLFADLLRQRLPQHTASSRTGDVAEFHRRAAVWYADNGLPADAIRHALTAGGFEQAANLIELAIPAVRQSRQEAKMLAWLQALPDEVIKNRPVLCVHYAGALLVGGILDGVEARLRDAERWLEPQADMAEMVVVDEDEFRSLAGSIAMYRAAIGLILGDVAATMKHARQVRDLVPQDDHMRRGAAAGLLGLAYWTIGDLEAAHRSYVECMGRLLKVGYVSDAIGCTITLADLRIAQGRLHEAMSTYERGLQLATGQGGPVLRGTSDMHVGMSVLYRERNDLNAATEHLLRSKELGELMGLPQNPYRWCVAMARLREIEGDLNGALDLLHEAERLYTGDLSPNVRPVAAVTARVCIAQGRLNEAVGWAREQGISVDDDLSYLHEFEHITLARLLLARARLDPTDDALLQAIDLLERLLQAAEEGERTGSVIEILMLLALAHQIQGDMPAALTLLERALTLAEPEGYVRLFVDEGSPMAILLENAAKHAIAPYYIRHLLTAFDTTAHKSPLQQNLIDPLSERELEVLRLLATDLNGPEIARELIVSLNTLRTHTKNIFQKLGANNRQAALRRARELDLI